MPLVYFLCIIFCKGLGYCLVTISFQFVSAAYLLAKINWKKLNFLLYFIILSKLTPYVSGNIDVAGLFFHKMFWSRLNYLMPKQKFFRCIVIGKNKMEIIELFAIFHHCQD